MEDNINFELLKMEDYLHFRKWKMTSILYEMEYYLNDNKMEADKNYVECGRQDQFLPQRNQWWINYVFE